MDLLSHDTVLLPEHLDLLIIANHLFELRILFLQDEQLLVEVVGATLPLEIQNVLQMLDLFLKLRDERVILSTDLVLANFCHDLLSPVGKL